MHEQDTAHIDMTQMPLAGPRVDVAKGILGDWAVSTYVGGTFAPLLTFYSNRRRAKETAKRRIRGASSKYWPTVLLSWDGREYQVAGEYGPRPKRKQEREEIYLLLKQDAARRVLDIPPDKRGIPLEDWIKWGY